MPADKHLPVSDILNLPPLARGLRATGLLIVGTGGSCIVNCGDCYWVFKRELGLLLLPFEGGLLFPLDLAPLSLCVVS